MKLLQDRIRECGKVLPGNIIKVDGFLNHRVDVRLMRELAKEFGRLFDLTGLTAVLTVEASGISLATICADEFGVPMILWISSSVNTCWKSTSHYLSISYKIRSYIK